MANMDGRGRATAMKILVAEGDLLESGALLQALEAAGHSAHVVEQGERAWERLTRVPEPPFDIIIAARDLPHLDGVSLCCLIRAQMGASPYFILFTEDGGDAARQTAIDAGADDVLVKPLNASELATRLEVARRILHANRAKPINRLGLLDNADDTDKSDALALPIGEILVAYDLLNHDQLRQALLAQEATRATPGAVGEDALETVLVAGGYVTEENITFAQSVQRDVPFLVVSEHRPDTHLLASVPEETARRLRALPIDVVEDEPRGRLVRVAVADMGDEMALDHMQRLLGRPVAGYLANAGALLAVTEKAYREMRAEREQLQFAETVGETIAGLPGDVGENFEDDEVSTTGVGAASGEEAPVIRFINGLFADATRRRASDIHIEPYKRDFEIRYRVDGDLRVMQTLPRHNLAAVTSRIKIMAELDIAERRVPQDGRISVRVEGVGYDLRVSTLPTQYGERVVMRILDRAAATRTLDELGFSAHNRERFESLIHRPHGIILVTGPTGSGKTTTLYATLNALRSPRVNIMTCEDPIEYELDRIGQSNVNVKAGLTFAGQLRAILRQDPDIVLVGEIRDAETAETAFRAALTGHLVLSTLHCNEAVGAPTRLLDMGVPPFLIASALIGSVAQRLVRKLCPHCRQPYTPSAAKLAILQEFAGANLNDDDRLYEAVPGGCPKCNGVGTRGRIGVHEVALVSEAMQAQIMKAADTSVLRKIAIEEKMAPMVVDGIEKARQGLTTLDDVQRKVGTLGVPMD